MGTLSPIIKAPWVEFRHTKEPKGAKTNHVISVLYRRPLHP